MRIISLVALLVALGTFSGCISIEKNGGAGNESPTAIGRYQLAGDGQGHFMKIDTKTGQAWSTGGATWANWYPVP
jgi:hypothetical protein